MPVAMPHSSSFTPFYVLLSWGWPVSCGVFLSHDRNWRRLGIHDHLVCFISFNSRLVSASGVSSAIVVVIFVVESPHLSMVSLWTPEAVFTVAWRLMASFGMDTFRNWLPTVFLNHTALTCLIQNSAIKLKHKGLWLFSSQICFKLYQVSPCLIMYMIWCSLEIIYLSLILSIRGTFRCSLRAIALSLNCTFSSFQLM